MQSIMQYYVSDKAIHEFIKVMCRCLC